MKLRVFTAFSGYDSQCMALDRAGIDYELVGWSEIDKYAIAAHNAVYPQYADRNFGDISEIDWAQVPDFDLFTYSSPCQDFSTRVCSGAAQRAAAHAVPCYGSASGQSPPNAPSTCYLRTWQRWSAASSSACSTSGNYCWNVLCTRISRRYSTPRTTAYRRTGNGCLWSLSGTVSKSITFRNLSRQLKISMTYWKTMCQKSITYQGVCWNGLRNTTGNVCAKIPKALCLSRKVVTI